LFTSTAVRASLTTAMPCSQDPVTDLRQEPTYAVARHLHRWAKHGCPVRLDVIMTRDAYCGPRNILAVIPLGALDSHGDPRQFDSLSTAASVPVSATDTGYSFGGAELWISETDQSALFLRTGKQIERWPWDRSPTACQ
jgi:hypothetical protein